MRLADLFEFQKKSTIKAGMGQPNGQYAFYTSSDTKRLFLDEANYNCEAVILGTGGMPSCNYHNGQFATSTDTFVLTAIGNVLPKFLYYFLRHADFAILKQGFHGAGLQHISKEYVSEIDVPALSIAEQQRIIDILDKLNSIISLANQRLLWYDELVKSRFVELFGEAETLIHNWDVKNFAEVTINLDSTRKPVKDADRQKMQGQYPYYGATGIVDHVNDYRIDGTFLLISEDGKALEFRNKDIAFIASGKIWVNNHAHVLQCTEDIEMIFLMYYMNFRNISDWVTGIDQKKLNRANMDKIPVGLPPIELQKQFSVFVKQTDKSKLATTETLKYLEELKAALMSQYFG